MLLLNILIQKMHFWKKMKNSVISCHSKQQQHCFGTNPPLTPSPSFPPVQREQMSEQEQVLKESSLSHTEIHSRLSVRRSWAALIVYPGNRWPKPTELALLISIPMEYDVCKHQRKRLFSLFRNYWRWNKDKLLFGFMTLLLGLDSVSTRGTNIKTPWKHPFIQRSVALFDLTRDWKKTLTLMTMKAKRVEPLFPLSPKLLGWHTAYAHKCVWGASHRIIPGYLSQPRLTNTLSRGPHTRRIGANGPRHTIGDIRVTFVRGAKRRSAANLQGWKRYLRWSNLISQSTSASSGGNYSCCSVLLIANKPKDNLVGSGGFQRRHAHVIRGTTDCSKQAIPGSAAPEMFTDLISSGTIISSVNCRLIWRSHVHAAPHRNPTAGAAVAQL